MNLKPLFTKFQNNLRLVAFEGLGLTVILSFLSILLIANIYRVITKGQANFDIYVYELNLLNELTEENSQLAEKLEYVKSDEYKKLLAREVLNLSESDTELFRTKKQAKFYDTEKTLLDVSSKKDYSEWWKSLLDFTN